nr:MAG TPA: Putative tail fiber protein fold, Tail fiber, receptor [Caudoviricetes sp.]
MHRVVIHLCSPLLCQTSWLQRQLLKDGIILITICVGIVSVQHQVLTISLSHGIVTIAELVYRMLVTLLYVSKQWGKSLTAESKASVTFPIAFERIVYFVDVFSLEAGRPCLFTKSHPITTNGFYWEYNYHGDDVGVQWLAIGV